jgi:hypothetical protein
MGVTPDRVMKEPSAAPVYEESHEGEKEHDACLRRRALVKRANGLRNDDRRRCENQECACHRSHGLGSAQPEGEARSRFADGDPHGQEIGPKGEDVRQKVQRVGLKHDAVSPDGTEELDEEEGAD